MRSKLIILSLFTLCFLFVTVANVDAGRRTYGKSAGSTETPAKKSSKNGEKSFDELIKDKVKIKGLFDFYHDTTDNSMLMAVKADQFNTIFLCGETRSGSEGAFFDNGSMGRSFPFYFKQVGKNIMILEKNLRVRADSTAALAKAIDRGISDHLFASTKIKATSEDSTKTILIDPSDLFIRDAQHLGYFMSQAKMGVSFDKKNSYFDKVKSFPENTEIDIKLHYKASKPLNAASMQNPYSMFHTFHYSLSSLPETDFVPRIADDRVGHFLTIYQDYSSLAERSPYVRYVDRWNLKKKNPEARISEPVEPIVFWVENTVPEEYRDAVAEGIEFWNGSFEKIGFRNAIVAKQMPDTADWDPADVRYNTIRWIIVPGASYAVGPSRANPFTGQIYDADVRVVADFVRYMFANMEYFIEPLAMGEEGHDHNHDMINTDQPGEILCNYGSESAKEAAFGLTYLLGSVGDFVDKDSLTKEYIHSYLVELIAHEVGHTLGFRHNFKASSIYTLEQLQDRDFTTKNSMGGTVMDYSPPNIAAIGEKQGEFYPSVPGPYDDWVIEYAYSDFGAKTPEEELPQLKAIADKASDPMLVYGTDEDAFGSGVKGIDPLCFQFDQGKDPIGYCQHKINLTNELWSNAYKKFEKPGEGYQEILRTFVRGWRAYYESARFAVRFVGGIHHNRLHVGDADGVLPFTPVKASEQRRAVQFLRDNVFAANAFNLSSDLLNKLQPERFSDFMGSAWRMPQIDYPIHNRALNIQNITINNLYNPLVLNRLLNNVNRFKAGDDIYTMYDMFTEVRRSIWSEIVEVTNVNSFRRQLQLLHLKRLIAIYLSDSVVFPSDARTLAANDLNVIESALKNGLGSTSANSMSIAHYKEVLRQIEAAKGAKRNYSGR